MLKVRALRFQGGMTDMAPAGGEYGTTLQAASHQGHLKIVRGVTRRVGLGLPQSYEVGLSPIGVGLSPMGIGLAAVVDS
jgi:hypothetical protein